MKIAEVFKSVAEMCFVISVNKRQVFWIWKKLPTRKENEMQYQKVSNTNILIK